MLKEFVVPYINTLKDVCGNKVGVVKWWGESYLENPSELFDLKKDVSPNNSMIQIQDPDLASLDLEPAVQYAIKHHLRLTFGLGASFLSLSSPEEIRERARKYALAGSTIPDFTFYLCNLGVDTSEEKIKIAISAARDSTN
jgi:hypothetical protein